MATHQIPGLSLAITTPNGPQLTTAYGYSNLETRTPATENTLFEIASITKVFTACAVLMLREDGSLTLQSEIGEFLPGLPELWRPVTIHQLLTHTSGIHNYTSTPKYWETTRLDISREAILDLVRELPLQFTPGSAWQYSNTGYYLLGLLIEERSGLTYEEFLRERIFTPLGMNATRANDPYAVIPHRAAGYTKENGIIRNREYYSASGTYAGGALLSSATDIAKWDAVWLGKTILPPHVIQEMQSPQIPAAYTSQDNFQMGLGWFILNHKGRKMLGHNGGIKGFSSTTCHFPEEGLAVTMMWNLDGFDRPDLLAVDVIDAWWETAKE